MGHPLTKSFIPRCLDAVGGSAPNQRQEFGAGIEVAENAEHGRRYGGRVLFLDATHHHAKVARFADHANTLRLDDFLDGFGDLRCKTFLHLEATREDFYESREFAQADYLAVRDVSDVYFAEERQHVMFTEAEHLDILDDDHFVIVHGEEGAVEDGFRIFLVAASKKLHSLANSFGSSRESFAIRVLPQADQHFAH